MDLKKVEHSINLIRDFIESYNRVAVCFSGGKDSLVLTYLTLKALSEVKSSPKIWFIVCDPIPIEENRGFCQYIVDKWNLNDYGEIIWYEDLVKKYSKIDFEIAKDKIRCCMELKVKPLRKFIRDENIEVLITAIRGDEHHERAKESEISPREDHIRLHPLLNWSLIDVWSFIKENNLPVNPLYFKGYLSLGCKPCTKPVTSGFKSVDEIIEFLRRGGVHERAGRDIDKERVMEILRSLGYF